MKNNSVCTNCNYENPHYFLTCTKCNHYLRDRVYNVDLWSSLWGLMESPVKTFKNIIYSEHKNFLILLLFLISLKITISGYAVRNALSINDSFLNSFIISSIISILIFILLLFLLIYGITNLNRVLGLNNNFKDNLALYTYSNSILAFGLILLTSLNYAIFGSYAFTFEYSPFIIKPTAAYVLVALEGIFFTLAIVKSIIASHAQTNNFIYSIIVGFLFQILLISGTIFLPVLFVL